MATRSVFVRLACAGALTALVAACSSPMMGGSGGASSKTVSATLSSSAEVPPNPSTASGSLTGSYNTNTRQLTWRTTYTGLTGPATMAHFHGPAPAGQNAGVVLPIPNASSGAEGTATLTEAQAADLLAGRWYVNVHTAAHPGGEIRGQVSVK